MKIYKYEIPLEHDEFVLDLPKNSKILSFQVQNNKSFIWAIVDEIAEKEKRNFILLGTGQSFEEDYLLGYNFIGMSQMNEGSLVLHLFVEETWKEFYNKIFKL